ncbi:MAG: HAD-IIB family hydrolase [Dehalococcoidia bacterium]
MRYIALACDYDGTLADDGTVRDEVTDALRRLRESGRRLVLVTGRDLRELRRVYPGLDLFEYVVAENGGLLYHPATRTERPLAQGVDDRFVRALEAHNVEPLTVSRVMVATREPHEAEVLEIIRDLGLELQVMFNKGAVMVLPAGVNKATGLRAALREMGVSRHNVVGVGDAENDHALLSLCEVGVAVANALPALREKADLVTEHPAGAGVVELVERMIEDDLRSLDPRLGRYAVLAGRTVDGEPLTIQPYHGLLLIAGTSGSGKSTIATGMLERFAEQGYEFCLIDPEGDYGPFARAIVLGDKDHPPTIEEISQVLERPGVNVIVNLLAVKLADRAAFFDELLPRIHQLRARTARPHWLVIDEAHHMLQPPLAQPRTPLVQVLDNTALLTPHPQMIAAPVLERVDMLIAVGDEVTTTVGALADALSIAPPPDVPERLDAGEALLWAPGRARHVVRFVPAPSQVERRRHERKYAEGELGAERSFYFRGPGGRLKLRAQNLLMFLQMADGVDADTWWHHLLRGDYSRWFVEMIKDEDLAAEARAIEANRALSLDESRALMRAAIEARYTLPGTAPTGSQQAPPQ